MASLIFDARSSESTQPAQGPANQVSSMKQHSLMAKALIVSLAGLMAASGSAWSQGREGHGGPGGHAAGRDRHGAGPGAGDVRPGNGRWYDGAHGHNHAYPSPGYGVHTPPQHSHAVYWGGANYRFYDGVWYSPWRSSWVVVRPPYGIVLGDIPAWFTPITIAGIVYLYANGVYYRNRAEGGYEVVQPPVQGQSLSAVPPKSYVYPRNGQTAQQQATDEYECHRWAVTQTGFDPTGAAVGQAPLPARSSTSNPAADYERARGACLEGRGYTVR